MTSFLEGMAGGIAGSVANRLEQADRSDLAVQQAQSIGEIQQKLELQKQQTLLDMQNTNTNTQRTQQVDRIDQAKEGIIAKALAKKYESMKPADPSTWTAEQQAAVDQAQAQDKAALGDDQDVATKAAIKTGDISPRDAMANSSKSDSLQNKVDLQNIKTDAYMQVSQARAEAMNARTQAQYDAAMAKVDAAVAKAGAGNTDFDKKINLLKKAGASDTEISNFITEKKQPSLEDLANGFLRADAASGNHRNPMTPDAAMEKAKTLRKLTATFSEDKGTSAPSATAKPSDLPAGAKQIGTSGGKPVYETLDGKRLVQK